MHGLYGSRFGYHGLPLSNYYNTLLLSANAELNTTIWIHKDQDIPEYIAVAPYWVAQLN